MKFSTLSTTSVFQYPSTASLEQVLAVKLQEVTPIHLGVSSTPSSSEQLEAFPGLLFGPHK